VAREFQDPNEIRDILLGGKFETLIGSLENEIFEAKAKPWDLETTLGKLSFAKDISSFANLRGGVIVIGVKPGPADTYQRNEVQAIHLLPISLTPTDRYAHILQEWIYPVPEGVQFAWHPGSAQPDRGLIGVYIPNQDDERRPFLVAHYFSESGSNLTGVVGHVQRLAATTNPTPVNELHTFLREGRRLDEIHQKLDAILTKIEAGVIPETTWMQRLLRRIR
jgi:hypothetical protein